MGFIKTNQKKIYIFLFIITFGILAFNGCKNNGEDKNEENLNVGVINYEELITYHPDYKKLEELDEEIMKISPDPLDEGKVKTINEELTRKMLSYQKEMEGKLAKERDQITKDSQAKIEAIHQKLETAFKQKQVELQKYQQELEKKYSDKYDDSNRPLSEWEKKFQEKFTKSSKDLVMLKERQIAAKKLELEKQTSEKLRAYNNNFEKMLADYEDQIKKENQNRKLDLQLKLQVAKDDEERKQIEAQLTELFESEKQKIEEKRKVIVSEYQEHENKEIAKNNEIMDEYRKKLDKDVGIQLEQTKQKVIKELYEEGVKKGDQNPFVPKEIKEKLQARQKQVEKEMDELQASLTPKIKQIEQEAKAAFEARRKELVDKMNKYQKELSDEFESKKNKMIQELTIANTEKEKAMKNLMKQKDELYKKMIEDINSVVGEVATENNIDLVVGNYVTKVNAEDLTDPAREAVENLSSTDVENEENTNSETKKE
ncbi:MAG: hypothetical protein ACLFQV_03275 [Vulcanimicrobiota bacterium]